MDHTYFAGIDNGLNGGITIIDENKNVVVTIKMPVIDGEKTEYNIKEICNVLSEFHPRMTVLEKAQAFPGQGVSSTFTIGKGFGIMIGLLTALDLPFMIVGPKTWQAEVLRDLNRGGDTKQASILFATRCAPTIDWRASERGTKLHDGKTDAFAMAIYAHLKSR